MAVAMAIASWRTCRGHDGMLSPNFYPNPFIEGELQHFQHFSIWRPSAILNFKNFNIWSRDCHWSRNLLLCTKFHKIGSRVRPPDAHNCWMLNAPLLGNGLSHVNSIMAAMSGRRWDSTTQVSSQSVHSWASYGISNMASVRNFELKKNLIFDHETVIQIVICSCVPNFIKIGSRVRPPDAHNCWIFNAPLLGTARAMATASRRTCPGQDEMLSPKFRPNSSIGRPVTPFPTFSNMAAVRHFEFQKKYIWSCDCHWSRNLLSCTKFHQNWFTRSASRRP